MRYIQNILGLTALMLVMFACAPEMDDSVDIGQAPTEDQLDFSITSAGTDFKFVLKNTSSATGIASWDLGNGSKSTDASPTVTYALPGEYTVTMTLITRGGIATKSKKVVQTKTDYSTTVWLRAILVLVRPEQLVWNGGQLAHWLRLQLKFCTTTKSTSK